jgi:hypothetical protein
MAWTVTTCPTEAVEMVRQMNHKRLDFNSILSVTNLLVAGLLVYAFISLGTNEYVDQETIWLGIGLALETQIALWLERKRRDPFVILLAFSMIFYYLLRLVTLTVYPFSLVFGRYPFDSSDSNFALIFIIIANAFLYAGFYVVGFRGNRSVSAGRWRAASPISVVFLLLAASVYAYGSQSVWTEDTLPRVFSILSIFLAQNIVMLMTLSYFMIFRKSLSARFGFTIATLIVVEILAHTLAGSRGAIVGAIQNYMVVMLAIAGCLTFRRRTFVLGIMLLPVLAVLLLGSFVISTYNRANKESGGSLDLSRAIALASESSAELWNSPALDAVLPIIAGRAGYFDYSAEIIAHQLQYKSVINPSAYARSIVDNILTPGFDVYDQPKISNALQFVYMGLGEPSKEKVNEMYQSDQLGIYGEFYALFGYASLPFLFLVAFGFKWIYVRCANRNPFVLVVERVFVLFAFTRVLDSFGIDWTMLEVLPLLTAMFIYRPFFASKLVSAQTTTGQDGGSFPATHAIRPL